jgi:hypothetical protein
MTTNEVLKVKNIWIDAPSKEFTDLYKIKKMQYIEDKEKIWLNKVSRESKNETLKEGKEYSTLLEKIGKSKDKFLSGVNYDKEKIMVEFNLGEFKARMLSKLASKQYPINIAPKVLGNDEAFYNKIKELNE